MTPLGAIALGAILGIIREAGRLDISTIVHHPIPRHFDHPDFPSLIDEKCADRPNYANSQRFA
jgi:hypothetical protein